MRKSATVNGLPLKKLTVVLNVKQVIFIQFNYYPIEGYFNVTVQGSKTKSHRRDAEVAKLLNFIFAFR
jgi:hypothetical protein